MCIFQSICPGLVKSNIFKSCLGPDFHEAVYKKPSLDPSDVASAIEYALTCAPHVEVSLFHSCFGCKGSTYWASTV